MDPFVITLEGEQDPCADLAPVPEGMTRSDNLIEVYLGVNTTISVNRFQYDVNDCQFETYLGLGVTSIGWDQEETIEWLPGSYNRLNLENETDGYSASILDLFNWITFDPYRNELAITVPYDLSAILTGLGISLPTSGDYFDLRFKLVSKNPLNWS